MIRSTLIAWATAYTNVGSALADLDAQISILAHQSADMADTFVQPAYVICQSAPAPRGGPCVQAAV